MYHLEQQAEDLDSVVVSVGGGGKIENISVLLIFYHGKKNRGRKERTFN